ncbi:MAG: FGGY family carbohydrate kinase, partial [Candidatus Methanomethyliaceae archaeon]
AKILWLKENETDVYKKTYKFLGVKDVLINRLTGRFVTDFSEASNTGMFDLKDRKWARDLIQELGIDLEKLVDEILPSQTVVGKINKEASKATGLLEGTPIVLGGGDVACAALGAGVIEEGLVYNYIGSASWFATASSRPLFNTTMRPFSLCHVVPDMYVVQLAMFSGGIVYEWVRDQICKFECEKAKSTSRNPYELMDELAASSPPGSNGIIFLPDLRPGGAPHNNLNAKGAFVGLTLSHKRGDLLRSVLEGITFNIRLMCDAMEEAIGFPFQEVRMIGGGSNSRLWREIEANVLNKVVVILSAQQEANSLGAVIIAGCGLGAFQNFRQATEVFIKVKENIKPNWKIAAEYTKFLSLFNNAYQALVPVNDQLSSLA